MQNLIEVPVSWTIYSLGVPNLLSTKGLFRTLSGEFLSSEWVDTWPQDFKLTLYSYVHFDLWPCGLSISGRHLPFLECYRAPSLIPVLRYRTLNPVASKSAEVVYSLGYTSIPSEMSVKQRSYVQHHIPPWPVDMKIKKGLFVLIFQLMYKMTNITNSHRSHKSCRKYKSENGAFNTNPWIMDIPEVGSGA
jgi:hypothetical protein